MKIETHPAAFSQRLQQSSSASAHTQRCAATTSHSKHASPW